MGKKDFKEIKEKMDQLNELLDKTFGDKSKLEKLDIETKFEGLLILLKANLFGSLSNTLTLIKMRELVEDDLNINL